MDYLTTKQYAEKLGVTPRRVQDMCRQGNIKGVVRHGREWLIPASATEKSEKSDFVQTKTEKLLTEENKPTGRVYGGIIDTYKKAGTASDVLISLCHDEFSYDLFASQLAFYRGEHQAALTLALKHFDENETDINHRIAVGMQITLATLFDGDLKMWRKGFDYLKSTKCDSEYARYALDFWVATAMSSVSEENIYPDWFCRGDFTRLPPSQYPMAAYNYVKHLYYKCGKSKDKEKTFEIIRSMPYAIEPLISFAYAGGTVVVELYLRLICALSYHLAGNDDMATAHLDRAIDLAVPDKLLTPLAEYRRRFGFLMDDRLAIKSPETLVALKAVSKSLIEGWTKIHNSVLEKRVADNLSVREWQAARLAAYGLQNKEIADVMGVTVNAVKQALRMAMDKTGCDSRDDLHEYI